MYGPRIYNLFPLLAGPIEAADGDDWYTHLDRVVAMGFDWLYLNPFHAPGFSGSLYAIKAPYLLHPITQGESPKSADDLLRDFFAAAARRGLHCMMDLVVSHTSKDALLAAQHPEWYLRDDDGELVSPSAIDPADAREVTVWGDLAQLDYADPVAREGLIDYWGRYLRHYIGLGVRGFRCDAAYQVPAPVWAALIEAGRREADDLLFAAETLGATLQQVSALAQAGFDYLYNSSKWWDFRAPWLLDQYDMFRHIAPSIAFPESHDTPRLSAELGGLPAQTVERHYRQRYAFAAMFSSGVLMPMGYEYGLEQPMHVVESTPQEWATQIASRRFDLSAFIAMVNRMKQCCPALNTEGPQRLLEAGPGDGIALLRLAGESGEDGCAVLLFNTSDQRTIRWDVARLRAAIGGTYDRFALVDTDHEEALFMDAGCLDIEPLGFRVLRGDYEIAKEHVGEAVAPGPGDAVIDAIVGADYGDPFEMRGMHEGGPGGAVVVRAFLPGAHRVEVIDAATDRPVGQLERLHGDGFFAATLKGRNRRFAYRLRVSDDDGTREIADVYAFSKVLGDVDIYLLAEGTHQRAYEKLGAHFIEHEGVEGVAFAVWAPNARRVSVVGDFNRWDGRAHPMRLRPECGVWELFVPGLDAGMRYKYEIKGAHGDLLPLRADPYARYAERPPRTASLLLKPDTFAWGDGGWMEARAARVAREAPVSIYEVHLGSWRRVAEENNRYLTYRELAVSLVPYVKEMGFTHIELLPVSEYPFDGSWGYQPIGLFAPTSRFGTPQDFQYLVDTCHRNDIGVLIDWVPGHFPSDPHGLAYFDGTHLFEHADPRQGYHQDWNTLIYNYGRNEVANLLLSNASFWLEHYHIDGLRVDAVASMLYLDYSRDAGGWVPNRYGGNENLEAVDLLRRMNELAYGTHPGAATFAEESTAWPGVTRPTYLGGLGFGYKWNMGWMHDTLQYMSRDPIHRRYHHHEMTFGMLYAYSENFVLPLSHDEVVHGKGSLLSRMPGDAWQQFANLRAYFAFMWTNPGKKLLFMGGEFAQGREWDHDSSLDWHLLDVHWHAGVQRLVRDLNHLYRALPALHQRDCDPEGFRWIKADDADDSIYVYLRRGHAAHELALVACNFTPVVRTAYRVGVPLAGMYLERLNTDAAVYGGSNTGNGGVIRTESIQYDGQPHSLAITVPPLGALVFEFIGD